LHKICPALLPNFLCSRISAKNGLLAGMYAELEAIADKNLDNGIWNEKIFWFAVKFQINANDGLAWLSEHVETLPANDADLLYRRLMQPSISG